MPSATLLLPRDTPSHGPIPPGTHVARFRGAAEVEAALSSGDGPVVLLSDGLTAADVPAISGAVRRSSRFVIEVRSERWDGQTRSELSASCRGVISGFGPGGISAALALLQREASPTP